MVNKLKWLGLGLLVMTLSSCMTAFYTTGRLMGHENPMRDDFPVGVLDFQAVSSSAESFSKKSRFALMPEQNDRTGQLILKRFERALQAQGYQVDPQADYLISYSYFPVQEGPYYKDEAFIKVKIWKNIPEKPLIWEAVVQNTKNRSMISRFPYNSAEQGGLLAAFRCSTFYGDFHFLKMDFFIAAIVNHLGKQIADPALEIHPKDFKYLSKEMPPLSL